MSAKKKLSEEELASVDANCTRVIMDVNSDAWKAKLEKIRQDKIRKNGTDEPIPQVEVGYRTGRR